MRIKLENQESIKDKSYTIFESNKNLNLNIKTQNGYQKNGK